MLNQKAWKKALVRFYNSGYNVDHSSQLRVVHTNQWPIPYYKRDTALPKTLYPEGEYNISMSGTTGISADDCNVFQAQEYLKSSMWGREVLETMHSIGMKGSLNTFIDSPTRSANAYTEDLLRHIDFTLKENARILKKHNFSDIFS